MFTEHFGCTDAIRVEQDAYMQKNYSFSCLEKMTTNFYGGDLEASPPQLFRGRGGDRPHGVGAYASRSSSSGHAANGHVLRDRFCTPSTGALYDWRYVATTVHI